MKVMNVTMPIFSAWLCYTMPAGMGLYWISGAVIRTILAIIVNHRIDKIDIDAMIEANKEKAAAKMEKLRSRTPNMNNYAAFHNRNLNSINRQVSGLSEKDRQAAVDNAINLYDSGNARPDSLLHAANMVREYDRRQDEKKQR
jgi:YidC/Oxa1 family membrane protein insertase